MGHSVQLLLKKTHSNNPIILDNDYVTPFPIQLMVGDNSTKHDILGLCLVREDSEKGIQSDVSRAISIYIRSSGWRDMYCMNHVHIA